jgi:hypothetical protein
MPAHFFAFLIGIAMTNLVTSALSVALGWHIYLHSGNPIDLAIVGLMQVIPTFLFFFATGWVVDSFPRKTLIIACTIAEALIMAGLAISMFDQEMNLAVIFSLLFVHGSVRAFYFPAKQAIVPNLVSKAQLPRAIALSSTIGNVAQTGGPLVAGLLIALVDVHIYSLLFAVLIIAAAAFHFLPTLPPMAIVPRTWATLIGGVTFVRSNSIVLGVIALDLFIVMLGSVVTLLPIYALDILKIGPEQLGVLRGMPAFGAVIAGIVLTSLPPMRGCGVKLFIALLIFSGSIIVFALSEVYWLSVIALFVYGASDMISVNIRLSLVQMATPDHLRGRVNALNGIFITSSNEMGDVRAGGAAAFAGPVTTAFVGGIMAIGVVVSGYLLFPKLRSLDRVIDAAPTDSGEKAAR